MEFVSIPRYSTRLCGNNQFEQFWGNTALKPVVLLDLRFSRPWLVMPCCSERGRCFGGTHSLLIQNRNSKPSKEPAEPGGNHAGCFCFYRRYVLSIGRTVWELHGITTQTTSLFIWFRPSTRGSNMQPHYKNLVDRIAVGLQQGKYRCTRSCRWVVEKGRAHTAGG
jgi:hypothetical protein